MGMSLKMGMSEIEQYYATREKEFIFGYYSCSVYNQADRKVHVMFSGWGTRRKMDRDWIGENRDWWATNDDKLRGYLAYSAISQAKDMLEKQARSDAEDSESESVV